MPGRFPATLDRLDHRGRVVIGLEMEHDQVAAGLREALGGGQRVADHEVAVEGKVRGWPCRPDHHRSHRQVVDEVPVHDVEVNGVDAGRRRPFDLRAQAREVGVEDAGADVRLGHAPATATRRASRSDRPESWA